MEKLFIIGNGFDIAHDLKTDYLYFKKFVYQQAYGKDDLLESLQSENAIKLYLNRIDKEILLEEIDDDTIPEMEMAPDGGDLYPDDVILYKLLYQLMSQITETEKFWSDFEEKLADFNEVSIVNTDCIYNARDLDGSIMASNANEIGEILAKYVLYSLNKLFKLWIEETYFEWTDRILRNGENSCYKLLKATVLKNSDATFLNFNYTKTLEDLYRIPEEQVFHLHGVIGGEKFIFGHGFDDEVSDFNPLDVGAYMEEVVNKLKKPVDSILTNNIQFFKSLSSIKEIYFIGFGIRDEDGVDAPYFKEIFKQTPDVSIYVDQFDKQNEYTIKKTLKAWGARKAYQLQFIDTNKDEIVGGVI